MMDTRINSTFIFKYNPLIPSPIKWLLIFLSMELDDIIKFELSQFFSAILYYINNKGFLLL